MGGLNSGGTLESSLLMDTMGLSDQMKDPFLLGGKEGGDPAESCHLDGHRFDDEAGSWVVPFMMAQINTRVVYAAAALDSNPQASSGPQASPLLTGWSFLTPVGLRRR